MQYVRAKRVSLKVHPEYNEKWLQSLIVDDSSILGLGELVVRDIERSQPRAGRLDLLLSDPESGTRYEVEIQLGPTDESHIIRTIEYWDIERARYPQYDHVAVLVAEDITSRFLNVISLFNKAIPIVAVQINALEVDGRLTLHATTVLDLMPRGTDEEPGQPTDRPYWEAKASPTAMAVLDQLADLVRDATNDAGIALKYNKPYIGLTRSGIADNFMTFRPRKRGNVLTVFSIQPTEELTQRIDEAGLDLATGFKSRPDRYFVRIAKDDVDQNRELLVELIRRASNTAPLHEE